MNCAPPYAAGMPGPCSRLLPGSDPPSHRASCTVRSKRKFCARACMARSGCRMRNSFCNFMPPCWRIRNSSNSPTPRTVRSPATPRALCSKLSCICCARPKGWRAKTGTRSAPASGPRCLGAKFWPDHARASACLPPRDRRGRPYDHRRPGRHRKSFTMTAIRQAYEKAGYRVIGLAPTNAVAEDMRGDGFGHAATVHSELFRLNNDRTSWNSAHRRDGG